MTDLRERLRPYWLHLYLLAYTPPLLVADAHTTALWQQAGLGLLTFAVLGLLATRVPREVAFQVLVCVGVATCFEVVGSLIWGVYRYRFHNLPLYVPPGHGLVYMFAITGAQTPLLRRHGRAAGLVVLAIATAWALAGITVLVPVTHRFDADGAALLPLLAWFLLRSPRATMFIGIFIAVAELELVGTAVGTWYWLPHAPYLHSGSGNPPSAIAGGYGVIDGTVLLVSFGLLSVRGRAASLRPRLRLQVAANAED